MSFGNTAKRVLVSIIAIPGIIAVSYLGSYYFLIFILAIALVSFHELSFLVSKKNAIPNRWLGFTAVAVIVVNQLNHFIDLLPFLLLFTVLLFAFELFRNKGSAILNAGTTLMAVMYIGLFAGSLVSLREFYPRIGSLYNQGGYIIISMLSAIWVCDSAAFFGGTKWGKHKLFPRVSPNKSWEGALFGFVFAVLTMIAARALVLDFLSWPATIMLGVIIGTIGQMGDLVESLIKRDAGVKDSSNLIPGHGGIFDRFDSLLFTAPVVLLYLNYFGR